MRCARDPSVVSGARRWWPTNHLARFLLPSGRSSLHIKSAANLGRHIVIVIKNSPQPPGTPVYSREIIVATATATANFAERNNNGPKHVQDFTVIRERYDDSCKYCTYLTVTCAATCTAACRGAPDLFTRQQSPRKNCPPSYLLLSYTGGNHTT